MRCLHAILLVMLAGCQGQAPSPDQTATLKPGIYLEQGGRGRLCIASGEKPQRAAFVAFAKTGMTNCSASGTIQSSGGKIVLSPNGEGDCQIPLDQKGDRLVLGAAPASCSYYCAPGLSLGGQAFNWVDTSTADTAAEPLLRDDVAC